MILANFSQQVNQTNNNNHHRCQNNRIQKSNNTSNNNNNYTQQTEISIMNSQIIKVKKKRSINNYIQQMGIPGVGQAYYVKQQQRINELNKTIANQRQLHLQQSVNRLYSKGLMKKMQMNRTTISSNNNNSNISNNNNNSNSNNKNKKHQSQSFSQYQQLYQQQQQQQNQSIQSLQQPTKPYYNELYSQDPLFQNQFRLHKLESDCQLMYKKLFNNIFIKKYKIWLAFNQKDMRQKQYKKMSLKQSDYKAKCSVMLIQTVERMFVKSVVRFLVCCYQLQSNKNSNYQKNKNNNTFISKQDQFIISYSNYLNHHNKLKEWSQNNNTPQQQLQQYTHQTQQHIKSISHKLPFIYYLLNYNQFVKLDQTKIKTFNHIEEWVMKWLRIDNRDNKDNRDDKDNLNKGQSFDWQQMYKVFENKLQQVLFTVPYQTKLYQKKGNDNQKDQNGITKQQQQYEDEIQTFQPFKANPIPQSTYQKPSSLSQQYFKKPLTQPIPFNFTQASNPPQKQSQQQYYSWNRQFKAKPIPKTLYQPQIIGTFQTQKQKYQFKKQHQQKLYKQAKFPKTMNYLQNFNQFQQEKKKQLQQKYYNVQNRLQQRLRPKEVPDFEKIHKREMYMLQTRKQINRTTTTQPKPFKFAQTKRADMRSSYKHNLTNVQFYSHQQNNNKNIKKKLRHLNQTSLTTTMPQAKSTAKFDAYVQLRRQQKQQRLKQQQYKEQMKKRQQQDKKRYKDTLKQRMHNQLLSQSKGVQYNNNYNNTNNNSMNNNINMVNLQQIYIERPLLMSSSSMNNNNKNSNNNNNKGLYNNDDTRTCFTDSYEPII